MDTRVDPAQAERDVAEIRRCGFVIVEDFLDAADLTATRTALRPHLRAEFLGRNDFEGHQTERVYSLVGRAPIFADLVEHPRILALCDAFLAPNYLLTASQAINIHPGETPQPLHTDDVFYPLPRPRSAVSLSTIYAVDPFTPENGATQVVPGSHLWPDDAVTHLLTAVDFETVPPHARQPRTPRPLPPEIAAQLVDVELDAGSVIVFLGTLVPQRRRTPGALEPILRAVGTTAGELHAVDFEGDGAHALAARASAPGIQHPSAVHGPRARAAPAAHPRGRLSGSDSPSVACGAAARR